MHRIWVIISIKSFDDEKNIHSVIIYFAHRQVWKFPLLLFSKKPHMCRKNFHVNSLAKNSFLSRLFKENFPLFFCVRRHFQIQIELRSVWWWYEKVSHCSILSATLNENKRRRRWRKYLLTGMLKLVKIMKLKKICL